MYTIPDYGGMLANRVRCRAYVEALRRCVRAGSVVLEIGTGVGAFAILACRLGARRVYALETNDAILVGGPAARANGCGDQVEFLQVLSTQADLPERADVVCSDLRGVLPLFGQNLCSILDAQQRLLAPGGVLIPARDTLWAAVIEATDLYPRFTQVWEDNELGLDLRAARALAIHAWCKARIQPEQLLSEPRCWATLEYASIASPDVRGTVTLPIRRTGTAQGLCLWFDSMLTEGVAFSNAPGQPELVYGQAFFPWPEAVTLQPGDQVTVSLQADLVGDEYVWRWDTSVSDDAGHLHPGAQFRQSTFLGMPLAPSRLRKRSDSYRPRLNEEGEIQHFLLGCMTGELPLARIARQLLERFPHRFRNEGEALAYAGRTSETFSR